MIFRARLFLILTESVIRYIQGSAGMGGGEIYVLDTKAKEDEKTMRSIRKSS